MVAEKPVVIIPLVIDVVEIAGSKMHGLEIQTTKLYDGNNVNRGETPVGNVFFGFTGVFLC